ncbi:hypothetical protein GYA27_04950 [candidate division WWE3 bacterium]|uniref:Uncharacterized protein n=1 Tax=candidate division WWE3 bacterium TaxID=2053526 RepID=A0A7X9HHE9_UNCKA|nr:hypothetical protein [candidate division WWE3 bacterium]
MAVTSKVLSPKLKTFVSSRIGIVFLAIVAIIIINQLLANRKADFEVTGQKQTKISDKTDQKDTSKFKSLFDSGAATSEKVFIKDCEDDKCFERYFKACEPATYFSGNSKTIMHYEIVKKSDNGCVMNFKYTTYPKSDWVNKIMTCTLDNAVEYKKAVANTFSDVVSGKVICSGPLYDNLIKLQHEL